MTISGGIYPGAPSYTIWVEGSNYFAKSATGNFVSGTNASAIISDSLASCNIAGGTVLLKEANYSITAPIILPRLKPSWGGESAIQLVGGEMGKWAQRGVSLWADASMESLLTNEWANDELSFNNVGIRGINFEANGQAHKCIDLINADTVNIEYCTLRGWTEYGLSSTWEGATTPLSGDDIPGKVHLRHSELVGSSYANTASVYHDLSTECYIESNNFVNGDQEAVIWIKNSFKMFIHHNEINGIPNVTRTAKALIYIESTALTAYTTMYSRDIVSQGNWLFRYDSGQTCYAHKIYDSETGVTYYPRRIFIDDCLAYGFTTPFSGKIHQESYVHYNGYFGLDDTASTNASGMYKISFAGATQKYPLIHVVVNEALQWYVASWEHDAYNWHISATITITNAAGTPVGAGKSLYISIAYYN